ncbi:MAG: YIP1 family protein [Elusimicrobiota bacterium]|nr:YIP1 family protein [Elusimicrobiota bacterium]
MENNYLALLYDLIAHPGKGLNRAREDKPWIFLVAVVILSGISIATGTTLFVSSFTRVGRVALFSNLFLVTVLLAFFWVINVGILHFFAEVWGKRGSVIDLFITLGLAMFPFVFVSPLSLVVEGLGGGRVFFQALFTIVLLLWCFFLALSAIREVYFSATFEALLILLTPIILFMLLSIFLPLGCILLAILSLPL